MDDAQDQRSVSLISTFSERLPGPHTSAQKPSFLQRWRCREWAEKLEIQWATCLNINCGIIILQCMCTAVKMREKVFDSNLVFPHIDFICFSQVFFWSSYKKCYCKYSCDVVVIVFIRHNPLVNSSLSKEEKKTHYTLIELRYDNPDNPPVSHDLLHPECTTENCFAWELFFTETPWSGLLTCSCRLPE